VSCVICGGQSGTGAGFLLVLPFPLPIPIPSTAPHSSAIRGWYKRPNSGRSNKWTQAQPHPKDLKENKNRSGSSKVRRLYAGFSSWRPEFYDSKEISVGSLLLEGTLRQASFSVACAVVCQYSFHRCCLVTRHHSHRQRVIWWRTPGCRTTRLNLTPQFSLA
jgi:hypothetical protein